jgi:Tfp pilus assembly protein PilO
MTPEDIKKLVILASFFLVIFLAFFLLFWRPSMGKLNRYRNDLRSKEEELIQLERDAKSWPETITQRELRRYEYELERLWSLIPSEEKVSMLLHEIRTHAESTNLEVLSLIRSSAGRGTSRTSARPASRSAGTGEEPEVPRYTTVPYRISLGGSYFGLVRFLRMLEDSERLVTVTGIRMIAQREDYNLVAEIQFNIFYSEAGVEAS